jgi:phage terminase large subunit GpA-like protein
MRHFAYQRGNYEATGDPAIERVSVLKSARIGYTALLTGARRISCCGSRHDCRASMVPDIEPMFLNSPSLREAPALLAVSTLPRVVSLALNAVGYYVKY